MSSVGSESFTDETFTSDGMLWFAYGMAAIPSILIFAYTIFWVWMLVDCVRGGHRTIWLFLMVFIPFPGALIYFIAEKLPGMQISLPPWMSRWTRGAEIRRAERDARNIGNARQYVILGDLLRETAQWRKAAETYEQALSLESDSAAAQWGYGDALAHLGRHEEARAKLETLLESDPEYRFGEAALRYCECLRALGECDAARERLEADTHLQYLPEARILLARVLSDSGEREKARTVLQDLLDSIESFTGWRYYRLRWQARKLLLKLSALPG